MNKTPLIITAGQQTREMILIEPFLTNVESTSLPKPWVKWSYEPCRPEDVPGAFMRAYATAIQQPTGPVFLSLPMDDWDKPMLTPYFRRQTSTTLGPDPIMIEQFVKMIDASLKPVLILGGDVARSNAWEEGIQLAEKLNVPVWSAPFLERNVFPEDHPLYSGELPPAIGHLSNTLQSHDLLIVIGAPIFRYYPWVPGKYLPDNAKLIHITDSAYDAAKAIIGDSMVSDVRLALMALTPRVKNRRQSSALLNVNKQDFCTTIGNNPTYPLSAKQVFHILSREVPEDYVLVQESPSNAGELLKTRLGTFSKPDSYYSISSGGLGWDLPASVGLAYVEKTSGRQRPVILVIGDGSFQYSIQSLWTAVQHDLHLIVIVMKNEQYGILKSFAILEDTPNVPGLDLPGLDIVHLAKGYGANAFCVEKEEEIQHAFQQALTKKAVTVLEVKISKTVRSLLSG